MLTRKNLLRLAFGLLLLGVLSVSVAVVAHAKTAQSFVCTDTGLTGPALQENALYCPINPFTQFTAGSTPVTVTDTLAPSTYQAAISLVQSKAIVVGTPLLVIETFDWHGCPVTDVEFSRGFHAEHHNVGNACNNGDLTVRIYAPGPPSTTQVWP